MNVDQVSLSLEEIKLTIIGLKERAALFGKTEPEDKAKIVGMWDLFETLITLRGKQKDWLRYEQYMLYNKLGTNYQEEE
tara:strand:- start:86 stop:322 length:237 start_codon:yes stop_codon:yes gene_type:complete